MRPLSTLLITFTLSWSIVRAQTFADFIAQLNTTPLNERQTLVDSFMNTVSAFPLTEQDTLAHFIYRGTANSVTVPGDANAWNVSTSSMNDIAGTNLWYRTDVYENDARLDYKFYLNGSSWILDPLNPRTILGGFGPNSELRMPAYVMPPEIEFYPNISHGTFIDTLFHSVNLGNTRTIKIYLPPNYHTSAFSFPMILVHDGLEFITLANSNNVLDYLIDQQLIEPTIGVFVPPVNRTEEYTGNLQGFFTSFIVNEVIPWVDSRFRTIRDPRKRAVMGPSAGGNISLWQGLTHPEVFGNVAAQSSYIQSSIFDGFQNGPALDLNIYMNLGTYDLPIIIPLVRNFIPILQSKGYTYQYQEYHEGHSWGLWRTHIDDALQMFYPGAPTGIELATLPPSKHRLNQNYPNPFNPTTTIEFDLPEASSVTLRIYNIIGEEVTTLVSKELSAGTYRYLWDAHGLASGVYILKLDADEYSLLKKAVLLE
jgi:enterochelin esterase family protein